LHKRKNDDGRPFLLAILESQLKEIRSICGGQNVYLVVNGTEVEGSFEEFLKKF
jgi:hypothetical protein